MSSTLQADVKGDIPNLRTLVELLKPITWFPPMWAFGCGAVSSGRVPAGHWASLLAGLLLCGPLLCATSQAVNDWFDRDVDAINEPHRPIPSGRMPGRWGLYVAICWTALSLGAALALGARITTIAVVGLLLAWAYSAPPIRLKRNGWFGNLACGLCYEGFAWITGAAVLLQQWPSVQIFALALLYSVGAHGIMTLNDYKSITGDRRMGIASLPASLGPQRAARVAALTMVAPQLVVVALLVSWSRPLHALVLVALLLLQGRLLRTFLRAPVEKALWYSGVGVPVFVLGMLISALALRG